MRGGLRAYAEHRKGLGLQGGNLSAVQKALKTKRIQASDGQIDFEEADQAWQANTNRHQQRPRARAAEKEKVSGAADPVTRSARLAANAQGELDLEGNFLEAQRQHEWLKVQKEELALKTRRGELMEKSEVEKVWGSLLTTFRNRLLLLPDKIAPKIAAISEVLECRVIIDREIRDALSSLSEYQQDAA